MYKILYHSPHHTLEDNGLQRGQSMDGMVEIKGEKYKIINTDDKIVLKRFNEKHKMWVTLHFPKGNENERIKIEEEILAILSNQYIQRNAYDANSKNSLSSSD